MWNNNQPAMGGQVGGGSRTEFSIDSLVLQETGTYDDIQARPYRINLDNYDRREMERTLSDTFITNDLSGRTLAGKTSKILSPSTVPEKTVLIPNGWDTRRLKFVLTVRESRYNFSNVPDYEDIYQFQGYTDYPGITPTGAIDPKMTFIINSYTRTRRTRSLDAFNRMIETDSIVDTCSLINTEAHTTGVTEPGFGLRPTDIFTGASHHLMASGISKVSGASIDGIYDTRLRYGKDFLVSSRSNNIPTTYMANIINAQRDGLATTDSFSGSRGSMSPYSEAKHSTAEPEFTRIPFIRRLADDQGVPITFRFTAGDLEKIQPGVLARTVYNRVSPTNYGLLPSRGQMAHWQGQDQNTMVATTLAISIPSLMSQLGIGKIHFSSTNEKITESIMNFTHNPITTYIFTSRDVTGQDYTSKLATFKFVLENEILRDISFNNEEAFNIEVDCELTSNTIIKVSMNGSPFIDYAVPTFCDSLMAPTLTYNYSNFDMYVNEFTELLDTAGVAQPVPSFDISSITNTNQPMQPTMTSGGV